MGSSSLLGLQVVEYLLICWYRIGMLPYNKLLYFLASWILCTMWSVLETSLVRFTFLGQCFLVYNVLGSIHFAGLVRLDISVFHPITNGCRHPLPLYFPFLFPHPYGFLRCPKKNPITFYNISNNPLSTCLYTYMISSDLTCEVYSTHLTYHTLNVELFWKIFTKKRYIIIKRRRACWVLSKLSSVRRFLDVKGRRDRFISV